MALVEVCISLIDVPGAAAGDVIGVREPQGAIGLAEGKLFLWMLVDEDEPGVTLPDLAVERLVHSVNLRALAAREPALDLELMANPEVYHQPFLLPDESTGVYKNRVATSVAGLIRTENR